MIDGGNVIQACKIKLFQEGKEKQKELNSRKKKCTCLTYCPEGREGGKEKPQVGKCQALGEDPDDVLPFLSLFGRVSDCRVQGESSSLPCWGRAGAPVPGPGGCPCLLLLQGNWCWLGCCPGAETPGSAAALVGSGSSLLAT